MLGLPCGFHELTLLSWAVLLFFGEWCGPLGVAAQAEAPTDVTASQPTNKSFMLSWKPGNPGECKFKRWHVQLRSVKSDSWSVLKKCSHRDRKVTNCTVRGLQRNSEYQARVSESCVNPSHNSPSCELLLPFWTLPGEWVVDVGTSPKVRKSIDVGSLPGFCRVEKECCSDEFGVCFENEQLNSVEVLRSDTPGGWGQQLRLRCKPLVLMNFAPGPTLRPAETPRSLEILESTETTLMLKFQLGAVGDCICPSLSLEIQGAHTDSWKVVPPQTCSDISVRTCTVQDLEPDTLYNARLRLLCTPASGGGRKKGPGSTAASSLYAMAAAPVATKPGCSWSANSGSDFELLCLNGERCDTRTEGWICCNLRGGRQRCPRSAPNMCAGEHDCANEQDYCCAQDCSTHSGPRHCEVPARAPEILSVVSNSPQSLTIQWRRREHLAGVSACEFLQWHAEVAEVIPGTTPSWKKTSGCTGGSIDVTSCTASGLQSSTSYMVRLFQTCIQSDLNSQPEVFRDKVVTKAEPPESPRDIEWHDAEPDSFQVKWTPGAPHDCSFQAWEVQYLLIPTKAEGEQQWTQICWILRWRSTSCHVFPALPDRQYHVRVREHCVDSSVKSPFKKSNPKHPATTLPAPMQAEPVSSIAAGCLDLQSIRLSWEPGNPRDCLFASWDIQLKPAEAQDDSWTVRPSSKKDTDCDLSDRFSTDCVLFNLSSDTLYDVRVRETCSKMIVNSLFNTSVHAVRTAPRPADPPVIQNASARGAHELLVRWGLGEAHDCKFVSWVLELQREVGNWTSNVSCIGLASRSTTTCILKQLHEDSIYRVRLREACTDPAAESVFSTIAETMTASLGSSAGFTHLDFLLPGTAWVEQALMFAVMGAAFAGFAWRRRAACVGALRRRCKPRDYPSCSLLRCFRGRGYSEAGDCEELMQELEGASDDITDAELAAIARRLKRARRR